MPFHQLLLQFIIYGIFLLLSYPSSAQGKKFYNCLLNSTQYPLKNDFKPKDSAISNFIEESKEKLNQKLEEVIVYSETPLTKAQPESTLGNWICDAVKRNLQKGKQKVDACIISYGSIGAEYIAPGAIRRKDFYQIINNENKVLLVSINGRGLRYLCDSIAQINGLPISGISFIIHENKAANITLNKMPINDHLIYTVAMNDYFFLQKKYYTLFANASYKSTYQSLREIVMNDAKTMHLQNEKIKMTLENRIGYAE